MSAARRETVPGLRAERGDKRGRAHSEEDKARVRQAFVDAGRRLLDRECCASVSLRSVAAEAGYAPGAIYQYFGDHRALMFAIREIDLNIACDHFEAVMRRARGPRARLRALLRETPRYWLTHLGTFDTLFAPANQPAVVSEEGVPFAESAAAQRATGLYCMAVDAWFATLPKAPLEPCLAADTLMAAVYGIVAFPRMTPTMNWTDSAAMADCVVDTLLAAWADRANAKR